MGRRSLLAPHRLLYQTRWYVTIPNYRMHWQDTYVACLEGTGRGKPVISLVSLNPSVFIRELGF
jgi:hypothetical protein